MDFDRGPAWSATFKRGADAELHAWRDLALDCCDAADAIALHDFRGAYPVDQKIDRTFVSPADRAIERLIRERIADAFPAHGIIGEEEGEVSPGASVRWYIDPIDGTDNFIRGVPLFGTLLAIERDGEVQVGVVSAPAIRERWVAWRAGGAWNRKGRVHVSDVGAVGSAGVVYTSAREILASESVPGFDAILRAADYEAAIGDFWGFGFVAEGRIEAMIEGRVHPWDLAAPLILIEEAGGRMTNTAGDRAVDIQGVCLASNGLLHGELLRCLLAVGDQRPRE